MAVSGDTAAKAVDRWELHGRVKVWPCGCRTWTRLSLPITSRPVYWCEKHRADLWPETEGGGGAAYS